MSRPSIPYRNEFSQYLLRSSGHARWPTDDEYWDRIGAILARGQIGYQAACDLADLILTEDDPTPGKFPKCLATRVCGAQKARELGLDRDGQPLDVLCVVCGRSGLLYVERQDGNLAEVKFRDGNFRFVRDFVAVCDCDHGRKLRAGHQPLPWHPIETLDRTVYQPVGGWPGRAALYQPDDESAGSF